MNVGNKRESHGTEYPQEDDYEWIMQRPQLSSSVFRLHVHRMRIYAVSLVPDHTLRYSQHGR